MSEQEGGSRHGHPANVSSTKTADDVQNPMPTPEWHPLQRNVRRALCEEQGRCRGWPLPWQAGFATWVPRTSASWHAPFTARSSSPMLECAPCCTPDHGMADGRRMRLAVQCEPRLPSQVGGPMHPRGWTALLREHCQAHFPPSSTACYKAVLDCTYTLLDAAWAGLVQAVGDAHQAGRRQGRDGDNLRNSLSISSSTGIPVRGATRMLRTRMHLHCIVPSRGWQRRSAGLGCEAPNSSRLASARSEQTSQAATK